MQLDYANLPTVRIGNIDVLDVRALFPDEQPGYEQRSLDTIDTIVIHHSADLSIYQNGSRDTGNRMQVDYDWHTKGHGWPGWGYHFVVDNWGHRFIVGGAETIRYHVSGKNKTSLGLCLMGNFEYYVPSMWQLLAVRELVDNIRQGLGRPLNLTGHGEYALGTDPTSCPGATFPQWRAVIDRNLMPSIVGGDFYANILADFLKRNKELS